MRTVFILLLLLPVLVFLNCKKENVSLPESCKNNIYISDSALLFYLPNVITPNGDGKNDQYHALGSIPDTTDFRLSVNKIDGENLFTTANFNQGWDGRDKNGKIPSDNIYQVNFRLRNASHQLIDSCTYLYILKTDNCVHLGTLSANNLRFEDQFDHNTGLAIYTTAEILCP
jgi:gliding motility-associated-like protein